MKVQLIFATLLLLQSCGESTKLNTEDTIEAPKKEQNKLEETLNIDSSLKHKSSELIEKKIIETHKQDFSEITIERQVWMTNNLNVNKFQNGDVILQAKSKEEWKTANKNKQPAWCYYDNDSINGDKHGKIYNFYAVNDKRELAPKGWHIASKNEFLQLERSTKEDDISKYNEQLQNYKEQYEILGQKMTIEQELSIEKELKQYISKKNATVSMISINDKIKGTRGTDKYGFNATSGGYRDKHGNFKKIGEKAIWKCSTRNTGEKKWGRSISKTSSSKRSLDIREGAYVRCIKN